MALASLCSRTTMLGRNRPSFTAFIVDHRLREGSDIEAEKVSRVLKQISIDTKILRLDWSTITNDNPNILANLESAARRLRFQALGRACRDLDINCLLLGHHGDDQAETILTRMISGYTGSGFRGIKQESKIPECHGIYGVSESGSPHRLLPTRFGSAASPFQIESGGIHVYRPLLDFQKSQLIATCEQNNVRWFEDPTNTDKGLTLRNTIRHLWAETSLPSALNPASMVEMAQRVEDREEQREGAAEALFNNCTVELDINSASLNLAFPFDIKEQLFVSIDTSMSTSRTEATHRAARLLRRILMLVTPKSSISLQDLDRLTKMTFPYLSEDGEDPLTEPEESSLSIAGLRILRRTAVGAVKANEQIQYEPSAENLKIAEPSASLEPITESLTSKAAEIPVFLYRIERERVRKTELNSFVTTLAGPSERRASTTDLTWTEFQFFDGRFWLRLRYRPFNLSPGHSIAVRFFDIKYLKQLSKLGDKHSLKTKMKDCAPGNGRLTLPAIVERYDIRGPKGQIVTREDLCALPTIGWGKEGWKAWKDDNEEENNISWMWECRYKMIEFGQGKGHSIKAPEMRTIPQSGTPRSILGAPS